MDTNIKSIAKIFYNRIPFKWRIPRIYYDTLRELSNVDNDSIISWQLNKLKFIVDYAYTNVPGYFLLYKEAGIKPDDIRSLDDIKFLPIIDKDVLRDNISDFTSRIVPKRKTHLSRTSGSTGSPFGFYKTVAEEWVEQAFVGRAWALGGWNIDQSGIMLRGAYAGDPCHIYRKCDNSSFYVHNNSYLVSPNYLTDDNYEIYRDFLVSHPELEYIFALPSSITLLSQLILAHNDAGVSKIKSIYLGSESVYDWQYDFIRKAFPHSCVISLYGQTERVIMAYWCANSQKYHIDPLYGITEILNGNTEVYEGETGELVGTSFWNTTTPFIRYRTKDFATKGANECHNCGLPYTQINRIEGRLQDVLIGKNGRIVSYTSFDGSLLHGDTFKDIIQYKIVQKEKGALQFLVKAAPTFDEKKKKNFERVIGEYLGRDFTISLDVVDDIKPGKNGKFNIVEQHLPVDVESRINKFKL